MRTIMPRCRVRPMDQADIGQVIDIERDSFPSMWPQTTYRKELSNKLARYLVAYEPANRDDLSEAKPEGESRSGPGSAGGFAKLLRRLFSPSPVSNDRVLGVVGLWCMMGEGHIVTIAVRSEYRRRGLGELLLVAILEAALAAGQDTVTLEYRVSNHGARALYEKYGFTQVGVRARYYSDNGEDAVLMSTPPLRSSKFRAVLAERVAHQRARWADAYPLDPAVKRLIGVTATRQA